MSIIFRENLTLPSEMEEKRMWNEYVGYDILTKVVNKLEFS